MIGMSFLSFLTLTIIGGVVAVIYHWGLRYRFAEGIDAAFGTMLAGWLGGWLGSPVLGHWLWKVENVYIVPAILGAIAVIHLRALTMKTIMRLLTMRSAAEVQETPKIKTMAA